MKSEKCVLYTRSSKDSKDVSPAAQRAELRGYAEDKGYQIVGDYSSDKPVSANANPPQLAEMLRDLKNPQRQWTVILAVESSRLARDMNFAGVIAHQVRKAGCRIEYSKMPSSGNAAMDMMVEAIARAWDQYHSMISKEKGLAGMRTNVQLGHRAGGRAPLGYALEHTATGTVRAGKPVEKSRLIPDPVWAARVKRYLQLRAEGRTRPEAARGCGLRDRNATTLIGMERNALVYAGITVWNRHAENGTGYRPRDQWVLQRGTHEAFITEAESEALMAHALPRPERRTRCASGQFLLSGFLHSPDGKTLVASGDGYYRAGKGRRIPAATLEAVVRDQMNEEVDSHEFTQRFVAELRRAADALPAEPATLAAERRAIAGKITNLLRLAEKSPDSAAVAARLRELEEEQRQLDDQIANAEQAAATRRALRSTTRTEARAMLAGWVEQDGTTLEEQRAALTQMVERIEFDPATGSGRVHYRIGLNGGRFRLDTAAADLGLGKPGYRWRPHGDPFFMIPRGGYPCPGSTGSGE